MNYTKFQSEEIIKCANSFEYFCETYVKIIHPVKGLVPFILYPFQKRVVKNFESHQFNIVKKFRQAGLTTISTIWGLHRCLFKFDQRIMVASKTDREAVSAGSSVDLALEHLPDFLQPRMKSESKHEKIFEETNSTLFFYTCSAARSKSLTILIVDEAAFVQDMESQFKSLYPTLATGGNCIIISTVNGMSGMGGWYYETYQKAKDKKNQFHVINLEYKEHPDYQSESWANSMRSNIGERAWLQEICGDFLGTSKTYIDIKIIHEYEKMCIDPVDKLFPEFDNVKFEDFSEHELANIEGYTKGALYVWKEPEFKKEYILCCDTGEGLGEDYSAFHVLCLDDYSQVAEFYSNTVPMHKFSQVIEQVGLFYNDSQVVIENLGQGAVILDRLANTLNYPNIFYENKSGKDKIGITINSTSRPKIMETLQTCFLNKLIRIRSIRLIRELKTFNYNSGKRRAEAAKNYHDDLVFSLALGLFALDLNGKDHPIGTEISGSRIAQSMKGKSLQQVRDEIFSGLDDDFSTNDNNRISYEDMMFNTLCGKSKKHSDYFINKEFGLF